MSIINDEGNVLFNSLFRPERTHTWDAAQAVNGITPEMVMDAPNIADKKDEISRMKLTKAAEYYGYDWESHPEGAHNSLGDCFATLHVYKSIKKEKQATQKKEQEPGLTSKRKYSKVKKGR